MACVMAFQIVFGTEEALPAGLALALGDGAERVETPRDGGEEPFLGFHVGGDRPEQRWLCLVGAVGAAQSLDGGIPLPPCLQEIIYSQPPLPGRPFAMSTPPGT